MSSIRKILLLSVIIILLLVMVLMREQWGKQMDKYFRRTLWSITIDTILYFTIIIFVVILYYNNFFDPWMLIE
jgi:hypothetical protein